MPEKPIILIRCVSMRLDAHKIRSIYIYKECFFYDKSLLNIVSLSGLAFPVAFSCSNVTFILYIYVYKAKKMLVLSKNA